MKEKPELGEDNSGCHTGAGSGRITGNSETMHLLYDRLSKLRRDLCRVNFEVKNLKPFPHLAFPHFTSSPNISKKPSFDGELMASCLLNYFGPHVALGLLVKWQC